MRFLIASLFLFLILLPAISLAGLLNFVYPTAANNSYINLSWTEINLTVDQNNISSLILDWTGTNYTLYDDSLLLALSFNNNSNIGENSTYAVDISKYSNNGTLSGAVWNDSGKFSGGLQFDAATPYVTIPAIILNQTWTISIWFNTNNAARQSIFGNGTKSYDYILVRDSMKELQMESITDTDSVMALCDGQSISGVGWVNYVLTRNSTLNVSCYRNGQYIDQRTFSNGGNVLGITTIGRGYTEYFNGTMDEIRIYNRTLSLIEISLLYQSSVNKFNSTQYQLYANISGLTNGTYPTAYAWANDSSGVSDQTDARSLIVGKCTSPYINNNFTIDLTEGCFLNSAFDIGTGQIKYSGIGNFTCNASINSTGFAIPAANQHVFVTSLCHINI